MKDVVYKNQLATLMELQTEIEMAIRSIDENMLQNVFKSLLRKMNACFDINGGQFPHLF